MNHTKRCDCYICNYTDKYMKAVETNDKEFLIDHYNAYVNCGADLEWYQAKARVMQEWLIKNGHTCQGLKVIKDKKGEQR